MCSREDSNLHGLPHTVLSRTRLPIPPRERCGGEIIGPFRPNDKCQIADDKYAIAPLPGHGGGPGLLEPFVICYRPEGPALAQPHRHQDVQEWTRNFDHPGAHFVDKIQIDFVLREIPKRSHEEFRVERD